MAERTGDGAAAVGAGKRGQKVTKVKAKSGRAAKRGGRARASKPKG